MAEPVCVISGVGPGTGTALVRRFAAGGYRIAMLARTAERLADLAAQVPSAKAYVCDVSDQSQVDATMALVEREMGAPVGADPQCRGRRVGNVHGDRSGDAQSELPSQHDGLALPRAARRTDHGDRWSRGNHCDRQYIRTARSRELCGLRTYESGATHPRRSDGAGPGPEGRARCLHCHRCSDRRAVGSRALQNQARRLFHRTQRQLPTKHGTLQANPARHGRSTSRSDHTERPGSGALQRSHVRCRSIRRSSRFLRAPLLFRQYRRPRRIVCAGRAGDIRNFEDTQAIGLWHYQLG